MDADDGENTEISSVIVPVSLIREISFEILEAIDAWHEARGLHMLDLKKCAVAIMAASQASIDMMATYPEESGTLQ